MKDFGTTSAPRGVVAPSGQSFWSSATLNLKKLGTESKTRVYTVECEGTAPMSPGVGMGLWDRCFLAGGAPALQTNSGIWLACVEKGGEVAWSKWK
jgi:hypothetical protein